MACCNTLSPAQVGATYNAVTNPNPCCNIIARREIGTGFLRQMGSFARSSPKIRRQAMAQIKMYGR